MAINGGASGNLVGGATLLAANVLSGNGSYGLMIFQAGTTRNSVEGNLIGLAEGGSAPLSNGGGASSSPLTRRTISSAGLPRATAT